MSEDKVIKVEGWDSFQERVLQLAAEVEPGKLWVYFTGSKDPDTGVSWCPDCVVAEPVVEKCFGQLKDDKAVLLKVQVGPRAFWKDPQCVFRTQPPFLKSVPTLIKWGTSQRLGDDQCSKEDMVAMIMEPTS